MDLMTEQTMEGDNPFVVTKQTIGVNLESFLPCHNFLNEGFKSLVLRKLNTQLGDTETLVCRYRSLSESKFKA